MWESLIYISSFLVHLSAKEVLFWTAEMESDGREAAFEAFDKIQWPEFVKYEINGRKLRKAHYPLLLSCTSVRFSNLELGPFSGRFNPLRTFLPSSLSEPNHRPPPPPLPYFRSMAAFVLSALGRMAQVSLQD